MTYTNPSIRRCVCGHPEYSLSAHLNHMARCPMAQNTPVPVPDMPAEIVVVLDAERRCKQAAYELRNGLGSGNLNINHVIGILEGAS